VATALRISHFVAKCEGIAKFACQRLREPARWHFNFDLIINKFPSSLPVRFYVERVVRSMGSSRDIRWHYGFGGNNTSLTQGRLAGEIRFGSEYPVLLNKTLISTYALF
jgi:hypothetical protein